MRGILHRHEIASHLTAGLPLINLLLVSGLAACAATGTGQPGENGGLGGPSGVMNVADAAIAGGDPEMALRVSQSVLATDPHNLDALYHEGEAYYVVNRCMDAIAVYKVALSINPASSPAELGIGRCELKQDAAQAELAFAAAVRDDPGNAKALNDLGIARDLQGNHAGAVGPYQQALLLDPGNIATEVNIGMSLALSGNGEEALQYLGPLATSPDATPKIRDAIWSKLLLNLGGGPIAILTGAPPKLNLLEPAIETAVRHIYEEAIAIATALGCNPTLNIETQLGHSRASSHKPSILQDLELGRPMEIESMLAAPLELARRAGVPTPTLDLLIALACTRAATAGLYRAA